MAEKGAWGKAKEVLQAVASVKNFHETIRGYYGVFVWATICDGFSSLPWVGLIFSGLGYGSIWMYLEMNGVSASPIGSSKRMAATAAEWVAGIFGLGIVPGITIWTYFAIAEHKGELANARNLKAPSATEMKQTQQELAQAALQEREGGKQAEQSKDQRKRSAYYNG